MFLYRYKYMFLNDMNYVNKILGCYLNTLAQVDSNQFYFTMFL